MATCLLVGGFSCVCHQRNSRMEKIKMSQITSLKLSDPKWEKKNMENILRRSTVTPADEQATKFLGDCKIAMKVKFLKYDKYFSDDDAFRDIYRVTFSRGKNKMSITFGQSIRDTTTDGGYPPKPYDVLACLTKYDPGTFENFCGDMGYNDDSIRSKAIYKSVMSEWKKVLTFFTPDELEKLLEIQ